MARDIFSRQSSQIARVWAADDAVLTFGADLGAGMVTQQFGWSYNQQVNILYEIGTPNQYAIIGRTVGQAQGARVLGPGAVLVGFYRKFGNGCCMTRNTLTLLVRQDDCGNTGAVDAGNPVSYAFQHCVLTSIGGQVNAGDMVINENFTMRYASLNLKGSGIPDNGACVEAA